MMRILLASTASYVPPRGGSTRSNLAWLDSLAGAGHACSIVASAAEKDTPDKQARVDRELREQGIDPASIEVHDRVEHARRGAIEIFSSREASRRAPLLREGIGAFRPDWVLVSSEDLSHTLIRAAHAGAPGCVVYLAHTPQFFPFGPESWNPDPAAADLVRRCAAVVAIGRHMAGYIGEHLGRDAAVVHPPVYGSGPFARLGSFENRWVLMVNPCAVKGIDIFLALAARFPAAAFAALPGWGTTAADRAELENHPNISLLANVRDIEDVLRNTRVLLMPSLWYEGFGLIAMEAMLRGIPVVASNSGGLVEAKQGTGYVVPVRPVERYEPRFDDRHMPRAIAPAQDVEPWAAALSTLLADRDAYEREAGASGAAAARFVAGIDAAQLEQLLLSLRPGGKAPRLAEPDLARLSPEKRALLLARLRRQSSP